MENNKIIMVRHHPMNIKFSNAYYQNQLGNIKNKEDVIFIDVTSRNKDKDFIKQISPFYIGPVTSSDGKTCKLFENFWQFSKVYEKETIFNKFINKRQKEEISFISSDENGDPTSDWFKLREFGFNSDIAYRHPFKGKTLYQYYLNKGKLEKLDYIQARKKVYIPEYAKLVYGSDSFNKIKALIDAGKTIAIIDFDAYNYNDKDIMTKLYYKNKEKHKNMPYTLEDYLSINTMKDVINFPGLLAGHGFTLKLILQGDIEVINGEIIDHTGVLK